MGPARKCQNGHFLSFMGFHQHRHRDSATDFSREALPSGSESLTGCYRALLSFFAGLVCPPLLAWPPGGDPEVVSLVAHGVFIALSSRAGTGGLRSNYSPARR